MTMLQLPHELLDIIVLELFPDCFDSLLLTCRRLHAVCEPHLQRYSAIRSRFQNFAYDKSPDGSGIHCSCQLLSYIAQRPYISRWILHADFSDDPSWETVRYLPASVTRLDDAVLALYKRSPCFQAANASQDEFRKEYSTTVDFRLRSGKYPNYFMYFAPTMLLTQLPNVRSMVLPRDQRPTKISKRVAEEIVDRAQATEAVGHGASLARLTKLQTDRHDKTWNDWRGSKLQYLPRLKQIVVDGSSWWLGAGIQPSNTLSSLSLRDSHGNLFVPSHDREHQNAYPRCVENALGPWVNLKTLRYSRSGLDTLFDMDRILSVIQDFVGEHLEELALSLNLNKCFPAVCRSSLRRFRKLRRLEIGLEVALCNVAIMLPFGSDESEFEDLKRDPSNPLHSVLEDLVLLLFANCRCSRSQMKWNTKLPITTLPLLAYSTISKNVAGNCCRTWRRSTSTATSERRKRIRSSARKRACKLTRL